MKKSSLILVLAALALTACSPPPANQSTTSKSPVVNDPTYTFFSDPSVTKAPPKDALFGNGQTLTLEYDGSKSKPGDTVFFQLFYTDPQGSVRPITGSSFDSPSKGVYTTSKKVYSSEADGRPGFMEVSVVQDAKVVGGEQGVTGKSLRLGMYPVQFQRSK